MYRVGIHTDVRKMYNTVKLNQADWCFQRYVWEENLDPSKIPTEKCETMAKTIHVAGMRWFPKSDQLALNVGELNFAKKCRGKKPPSADSIIPSKLTRRHCASKVAEIFDLTGKVTPIVAAMKMDLQKLLHRKLDWDDTVLDELRQLWGSHFDMMQEINNLRYQRAIVPEDAINLDINTIDFGDASKTTICSCIYARFQRRSGEYSCQNVLSRSRVVPKDMSLPGAELYASLLNTYTGEVVKRSFKEHCKSAIKLTDSQISLFWITNNQKPLELWVRNRVIEIQRFTNKDQWYYIESKNMLADIGTRRGVTLKDVDEKSLWINGHPWMIQAQSKFPIWTPEEVKPKDSDLGETKKDIESHTSKIDDKVKSYYSFSKYLINPNQHTFTKVVRILAYVIRFCEKIKASITNRRKNKSSTQQSTKMLTINEINASEDYFYKAATKEVTQFVPLKKFDKFTTMKNGILHYTGRILPSEEVSIVGKFTSAMKDLSKDTFCVPVLSKDSPIAYSIAMDVYWNDPVCKHSGVETTLRFVMKKVFIIEGRSLIKSIRKRCQRCRYLTKKSIDVVMGPISESNLTIAPAFYASQVDLSGPYSSFSPSHKRTTTKIWLAVFCCCTTSATSINVMDNYSTDAFVMSLPALHVIMDIPRSCTVTEVVR